MVEGASIDKQAHESEADRTIWDTIEFDNAVPWRSPSPRRTNGDADPANDTLVVVTADHESGGFGIIGVGNERYAPSAIGRSVRDYAATFRFQPAQTLNLFPSYTVDAQRFPVDPDPPRKLLLASPPAPDRYENWLSNRLAQVGTVIDPQTRTAVANPRRDGPGEDSDNPAVDGTRYPGFLVARRDRERRHRLPRSARLSRRHAREPAGDCRPHRQRRAAVGRGAGRLAVHRRLREHRRVPQAAAGGSRQLRPRARP